MASLGMKTDVIDIEGMGGNVRGSDAGAGSVIAKIVGKIHLIEKTTVYCLEVMSCTVSPVISIRLPHDVTTPAKDSPYKGCITQQTW